MRERFLLSLLFALLPAASALASGQEAAGDSAAAVRRFAGSVAVRAPAPGALSAYRDDPDFQYEQAQSGTSWWARLRRWVWETFFEPLMGPMGGWRRPILYVLLGAVLLFALVQFVRMRAGSGWRTPARRMPQTFREIEENLQTVDLGALVEEAAAAGEHRRAVRLMYLHALRTLADHGAIDWNPAKTNRAYLREIDPPALREELSELTRLFERVWYGHAEVTPGTFARLRPRFARFRRRVAREGAGEPKQAEA